MQYKKRIYTTIMTLGLLFPLCTMAVAQQPDTTFHPDTHHLFTAGVASGLMGGLYDGFYAIDSLKTKGDFGLGAPDKLDGEIMVLNGKFYQTQSSGKTFEMPHSQDLVPFCMVNYFKPDRVISIRTPMNKTQLYACLDSLLPNANGMYAIHIRGQFEYLKTRAFPPVQEQPYPQLAGMLNRQHFFQFNHCKGDLIGYRLPAYMDNTNISGYHFHYLSDQKDAGGHIVDITSGIITIEISQLNSYTIAVPDTPAFNHFDFKKDRQEDIKSVERGSVK